jgi:hypothetical protein
MLVKRNSNDILFALYAANSTPEKAPKPLSADFSSGAMETLQKIHTFNSIDGLL